MRKFIIEATQTKRELPLPFAMSVSVGDLEWLAEKLTEAAHTWRHNGVAAGWLTIADDFHGEPNTRALPWDACGGPGYQDKVPRG